MKKIEAFLAALAAVGFAATVLLALNAIGALIFKGTAPGPVAPVVASAPVQDTAMEGANGAAAAATLDTAAETVSAENGAAVFKKCKACHTVEKDGKNGTGPNLWGIVGAAIAAHDGFAYSDAMQAKAGTSWDVDTLDAYLTKPKDAIPGNKMAFAGIADAADRHDLIAFLATQSDTPQTAADLGFAAADATAAASAPAGEAPAGEADAAAVEITPVPYPEGVTYADPPAVTAEEAARSSDAVAAIAAELAAMDHERAVFHPIHFPPLIEKASNEECLVCHKEILDHQPRAASPAGVPVDATLAWYQTLDTYTGPQSDFHWRHLDSDFAKQVMNLQCNFCHKGNDPREESPDMMPSRAAFQAPATPEFTLRKMVNPSTTCLLCHGAMPDPEKIMGLAGHWPEARVDMETPDAPNGCLSCHAELFRTVRHNVSYLKAASIEALAREGSSDTCYGCHGGRAWYRISYPYPRHAWPGMDDSAVPDWATDRPTESDPAYALPAAAQ